MIDTNMMLAMKFFLICHDDMDGAGCEISFKIHCRELNHMVLHTSIGDISDTVSKIISDPANSPDKVILFFADLSPVGELLYELISMGYQVYRFDHHPTAAIIDGLAPESVLDVSGFGSGTTLIDTYLRNNPTTSKFSPRSPVYNEFIENIRQWDTWAWAATNNLQAKYLVNLFWLLGYHRFVDLYVKRWIKAEANDRAPIIAPEHMIFVEAKLESSKSVIDATTPASVISTNFFGNHAAVMFAGAGFSISDGSNSFLSKYPEYDMMIYINMATRTIGFRTVKNDLDLGQLARRFGGGGHAKAAGCPIPYALMMKLTEELLFDDRSKNI